MASNVFGNPVTDETVRQVYPNVTEITANHRAEVALLYMNADEKATNVSRFVHNLKSDYGTGTSTLGMIYNATGGNLRFVLNHTWEGQVWRSPYPQLLQNGQWLGFLHVRGRLIGPSKEAIVYRGANDAGATRDWMMAFNTTRLNNQNRVYTEIRTSGGFDSVNWSTIDSAMERQTNSHSVTQLGCFSTVSIGSGSSPEFVGIMSLPDLSANAMAMASDLSIISPSLDSKYKDGVGKKGEAAPGKATAAAAAAAKK